MKRRLTPYLILLLLSCLLTVLPSAMWPDMYMPMGGYWENWYWKGQPYPRPSFSLQNPPPLFRAELMAYKTLVAPAAYVHRAVTGLPTWYASFFMDPYSELPGYPPFIMALEHARWALPTWFSLLVIVYEVMSFVVRRLRTLRSAG